MPATITDIFRYPVKSMKGHSLTSALMTKRGIPGDRAWALKDEERGGIKGGKRFPQLMSMTPAFASEPNEQNISPKVSITLANGRGCHLFRCGYKHRTLRGRGIACQPVANTAGGPVGTLSASAHGREC